MHSLNCRLRSWKTPVELVSWLIKTAFLPETIYATSWATTFTGRVNVYEKIKPTCNFLTRFVLVEKLAPAPDVVGPYVVLCGFLIND